VPKKIYKSNATQLLAQQRSEPVQEPSTIRTQANATGAGPSFTKAEGNAASALLFG